MSDVFSENSSSSGISLLSNVILENAGSDLYDEANADVSDAKSCKSSESEKNKQSKTIGVISELES